MNKHTQENFDKPLAEIDPDIFRAIELELGRQKHEIELIASENIVSRAVLEAQGSIMTNKYAEGYPNRRYYGGCEFVDIAEQKAIERLCELFGCRFANVQPHSGSQANQGVFTALIKPGDTILGMDLSAGGHLTHGAAPNQSGKWFNAVHYGVRQDNFLIDYDQVGDLTKKHSPKLIIAGGSAIPRHIDFGKFRAIADEVGAYLLVDMAHFAGLVAGKVHPSPINFADVVTSTTHKTLRGPRGGVIMTNNPEIAKKVNSAIFPGIQGGPMMHTIAAKAVAFGDALKPQFRQYSKQVVLNAKALSQSLMDEEVGIITDGTDTHIVLVDLRPKGLKGNEAESALGRTGITCNKNAIPFDTEKPMITSGLRLGTPACTTRGFGEEEFRTIGKLIVQTLDGLKENGADENSKVESEVRANVKSLCDQFPIYE